MSDFCAPYIPMDLPPRSGFLGTRATALAIATATFTAVTLPVETQDIGNYFTAGASVGTVPSGKAGLYAITGEVVWATSALGTSPVIRLVAGGITYDVGGLVPTGIQGFGITVPLVVGDTVGMWVYQNSGVSVNVNSARLSAYLIGL